MEQTANIDQLPVSAEDSTLPTIAEFEPVEVVPRHDGWTPSRQRAFIEELADCGIVREAAARVGMSEQSARRLRRRADAAGFSRAWDAAVQVGIDRLHSVAVERAINGTVRLRYYHDQVIGEERVYDNRLLIYLLGRTSRRDVSEEGARIKGWEQSMDAFEDGMAGPLPAPDQTDRSPVWRHAKGTWLTSFPPPEGFQGRQRGEYGNLDYCRTLTPEEQAKVDLWQARSANQGPRMRDSYFARLA